MTSIKQVTQVCIATSEVRAGLARVLKYENQIHHPVLPTQRS